MSLTGSARNKLERLKERIGVCQLRGDETVGFNMSVYVPHPAAEWLPDNSGHGCGTVCCIAGHALIMAQEDHAIGLMEAPSRNDWIGQIGEGYLGLEPRVAVELFTPSVSRSYNEITVAEAQEAIQSILDSDGDRVTWKRRL